MSKLELICGRFESISQAQIGPVDLVIADPPDNIVRKYDGVHDDSCSERDYARRFKHWLLDCCEITDGPVFWIFNQEWIGETEHLMREWPGFVALRQRLMWYWTFGQNNANRYTPCMRPVYWLGGDYFNSEAVCVPSKRQVIYGDKRAKSGGRLPDTFWGHGDDYGMLDVLEESRVCGNQIAEGIYERIIRGHLKPGGRVLDPFIGSGTCARVCQRLGVDCVGIDVSQNYLDKIGQEMSAHAKMSVKYTTQSTSEEKRWYSLTMQMERQHRSALCQTKTKKK